MREKRPPRTWRRWTALAACPFLLSLLECTTFEAEPRSDDPGDGALEEQSSDGRGDAASPVLDGGPDKDGPYDATSAGCNGALDCERVVFVTSTTQRGDAINGLGGADLICTELASKAAHPRVRGRTFVAWLSGPVDAAARLVNGRRAYVLPNATPIAANFSQLASASHLTFVNVDENGAAVAAETGVWTGSDERGQGTPVTCASWLSANPADNGQVGRTDRKDKNWSNDGTLGCAQRFHLYCVER